MQVLHIGQTAREFTTVDPIAVALGLCVFLAVAVAIWRPMRLRIPSRHRLRLARGVVAVAVAAAVLPSVLPFDHLHAAPTTDPAMTSAQVHDDHCHTAPGSCSDAPVPSGPGQFLNGEPLASVPVLATTVIFLVAATLVGITIRPGLRPPLATPA